MGARSRPWPCLSPWPGGALVSRATLHNEDEIRARDVRVGDTVMVQRAGDVIPEVVGPVLEKRPAGVVPFVFPRTCPALRAARIPGRGRSRLALRKLTCPAIRLRAITHFVSKAGLDVQGVGQKWIEQLVTSGRVQSPADLFTLTAQELLGFERMGEVLAQKFVDALDAARHTADLRRLISALGIRHVGEQTARTLAGHFCDLDALENASAATLQALPDVGPEVASSIRNFFDSPVNWETFGLPQDPGPLATERGGRRARGRGLPGRLRQARVLFKWLTGHAP